MCKKSLLATRGAILNARRNDDGNTVDEDGTSEHRVGEDLTNNRMETETINANNFGVADVYMTNDGESGNEIRGNDNGTTICENDAIIQLVENPLRRIAVEQDMNEQV